MKGLSRRYEVLLPLRYNDGRAVPDELFGEVLLELRQRFGAASSETQIIRGFWHEQEQEYRDELIRVFVDVLDNPDNRQFFINFKERLKEKFNQLEIWITTYPVEIL